MLAGLSESNPVFAPGVGNYVAMGGVRRLWQGDLAAALREALAHAPTTDCRAEDGAARGGRKLSARIAQQVLDAP
jgi:malonate decarboxylase gamma subunit